MDRLQLMEKIISRSTIYICKYLDPAQLLLIMQGSEALTHNDVKRIKAKETESDQSEKLLDILMRKPTESYDAFMDALLEIGREDIHDWIQVVEREVGYIRHGKGPSEDSLSAFKGLSLEDNSAAGPSTGHSASHSAKYSAGDSAYPSVDHWAGTSSGPSAGISTKKPRAIRRRLKLPEIKSVAAEAEPAAAVQIPSLEAAAELELRQRQIIAGPWNMVSEFGWQDGPGKIRGATHMTLSPDGDVVIADYGASQIKIYTIEGVYKSSIHTQRKPLQIAVNSNNTCFITDGSHLITMYELDGKNKGSWVSSCPDVSSPAPVLYGLAIDHAGDLLLGDYGNKYIYKHRVDGTHVASIKVCITPHHITVTSQGTIVIANWDTNPQVISNIGDVLHTLMPPVGESQWEPYDVYGHDGIIFVSEDSLDIWCYSESGKYLGPMIRFSCRAIAMTSDSKTLLVCEKQSVKVYSNPSIQQ